MAFNEKQVAALTAPLDRANVKSRNVGGSEASYVESWFCIVEANRIFGPGNWDRETILLNHVSETTNNNGNVVICYVCQVKITVRAEGGSVVRIGTGFGSGIAKDAGQAHESAVKEAESDAMKRALITFGYTFGLALYDKEQKHVETKPDGQLIAKLWLKDAGVTKAEFNDFKEGCAGFGLNWIEVIVAAEAEGVEKSLADLLAFMAGINKAVGK